jgi:hypothetical protein
MMLALWRFIWGVDMLSMTHPKTADLFFASVLGRNRFCLSL